MCSEDIWFCAPNPARRRGRLRGRPARVAHLPALRNSLRSDSPRDFPGKPATLKRDLIGRHPCQPAGPAVVGAEKFVIETVWRRSEWWRDYIHRVRFLPQSTLCVGAATFIAVAPPLMLTSDLHPVDHSITSTLRSSSRCPNPIGCVEERNAPVRSAEQRPASRPVRSAVPTPVPALRTRCASFVRAPYVSVPRWSLRWRIR